VLVGRSYESEQVLPFGPWVDALRPAVTDDAVLASLNPVWRSELTRLFPEIAGPALPAAGDDARRLFEGVTRLVQLLTVQRPLVLILEDLHWADEMSLRLLAFLCRRAPTFPLLVTLTVREEELPTAPVLLRVLEELGGERHVARLTIPPLPRGDAQLLVRALARSGHDEADLERLGERIWAASEGNPFVITEAVRSVDHGTPSASLPFPDRVQQLIAGRVARFSPQSQELLAVAAVIGREFEFALLQRAAGLPEHEATAGIEELVRRRAVHFVGERFDFTHERFREVVHRDLLAPRRALLHRQVADALETLYAGRLEPHYAALGFHYNVAEVWEKAATYLRRAGVQAAARSAYRQAVDHFQQTLQALGRLPTTREVLEQLIDVRFDLRHAAVQVADVPAVLADLREAEALARTLGDPRRLGWVSDYMSNYFDNVGEPGEAINRGREALETAEALGDFGLQVAANYHLGCAHYSTGDYRAALDCFSPLLPSLQGAESIERFGLAVPPAILCRTWAAWCLAELGEFAAGRAMAEEAVEIAEVTKRPLDLLYALRAGDLLSLRKGDVATRIAALERGLDLCRAEDLASSSIFPWATSALGYAYALSGHHHEALPLLLQSEAWLASHESARPSLYFGWLSEAYLLTGQPEKAATLAESSLDGARARRARGYEAWALRLLGEIAARRDPPGREIAEAHYRAALRLAGELGMRPLVAHCHLGLGALYRSAPRTARSSEHLTTAATLYRSMEMGFWLARAEEALGSPGPHGPWSGVR
jgi:tetratricopeptide (TPR) repeat protein